LFAFIFNILKLECFLDFFLIEFMQKQIKQVTVFVPMLEEMFVCDKKKFVYIINRLPLASSWCKPQSEKIKEISKTTLNLNKIRNLLYQLIRT
jgi:hypothetical protein